MHLRWSVRRAAAITALPPVNAWLLIGDEASFPQRADLMRMRRRWQEECFWTSPKQVQPGDLLLFYFVSPRKAVHFAARAAAFPTFDPTLGVNALRDVDPNQWWVKHTPLVPVAPIPFSRLRALSDGHLMLRGRPRHYLPPQLIESLLVEGDLAALGEHSDVLRRPVGSPELPDPGSVDLGGWRRMADGRLLLEAQVEQYVVEPMLRLALDGLPGASVHKRFRLPRGVPDYVVLRDGAPAAVVEVKLGVRVPEYGDWHRSPDFRQVMRYSRQLDVPALLVDSNRLFLIPREAKAPTVTLLRTELTEDDLQVVAGHLAGR